MQYGVLSDYNLIESGGATQPLPRDREAKELRRDSKVEPHAKVQSQR